MKCSKCGAELYIDRLDENKKIWYTCMNEKCSEFRKSFNPTTDDTEKSAMKPRSS